MYSPARWVQELYPVDEMLARKELSIPLEKITLSEFEGATGKSPTYRVHAYDAAGKEILAREFTVTTVMQPYNGVIPDYEQVRGGYRLGAHGIRRARCYSTSASTPISRSSGTTTRTRRCPRSTSIVMAQAARRFAPRIRAALRHAQARHPHERAGLQLDLDKERISSLEALQEDTFYSTENFVNMMGDLRPAGRSPTSAASFPSCTLPKTARTATSTSSFTAKPAGESAGAPELDRCAGQAPRAGAQPAGAHRRDAAAPDLRRA